MYLNNFIFLFSYFLKKKFKFFLISLSHMLEINMNGFQHLKSFSQLLNFRIGHAGFLMTLENLPHFWIQLCIKKIKNVWREIFLPHFYNFVDKLLLLSIEAQQQFFPLTQLVIHLKRDVCDLYVGSASTMLGTCLTVIFGAKERVFSFTVLSGATIFYLIIARTQPLDLLDRKATLYLIKFHFWNISFWALIL